MIFRETVQPGIEDFDRSGRLSPQAALEIFENIGSHHSDSANDGVIEGSMNGITWILAEWRVEINRTPVYGEKLTISTWTYGKAPSSQVNRDYEIKDENGETYIKASSKFVLFDLECGKITKISEELFSRYKPESTSAFENKTPKLKAPDKYTAEKNIGLRRTDIDFNGHLHNVTYLTFALEAVPFEVYKNVPLKGFRINYKKSVSEDALLTLKCAENDGIYTVGIYNREELCSIVQLDYSR